MKYCEAIGVAAFDFNACSRILGATALLRNSAASHKTGDVS